MAELYAALIINGKRTLDSVPKTQQKRVKEILIASGKQELTA